MKRLSSPIRFFSLLLLWLALAGTFAALSVAAGQSQLSPQALVSKLHWRSIGPYIGGRVVAVDGVASEPNLFYMGAVGGGVWRSTNYGVTWRNITDGTLPGSSSSIGAIAVAPSNPKILYAGTGECDIRADAITGDGVYRSSDSGATWRYAGLRETHTICNLVVDPKNPDVVYASSMGHVFAPNDDRGVFKTTDGGKTWRKVLFVDSKTGAIDLIMDPGHPNVLYATMWQANRTPWSLSSGGPGSGIYKTTDGGAKWTNISHNQGLAQGLLGRIGVGISASHPNVVYAIEQARAGGVFRSSDGGKTWVRVNDEWKLRQRAFYYMAIFVDPKDPNTVYAPEVDALWVSRDGGKTFSKLRLPHGDNHILWINPKDPRILLEGNDGGATVSTDGGKTWSTEHNQPTGQFYHVNLDDRFPYHVYGAQQDEGSYEGPSATAAKSIPLGAWHTVAYGESTVVVPQPGDPNVTYGSGYFSIFLRYDMANEQYSSVSPWPNYKEGTSSGEQRYRFAWTHPILFSPVNPKELLIGSQDVFRSDDYGRTWQRISPDLTRNSAATEAPTGGPINLDQSGAEIYPCVSSLAVSPVDGAVIWAGSDDGMVHVTTDAGKQWLAAQPPGLPESSDISSIEPSRTAAGTAYLTAERYMWDDFHPYVYKTTDYGRHWTEITGGLPADEYAFTIREDPRDPSLLLLGTRSSVYASFDAGASWQKFALNLPPVQVRDLRFDARQGQVAIATHGRSFWVLDDLALLEQMTKNPAVSEDGAYLFAPEEAWLTHAYGLPGEGEERRNTGQNPPFGATVFFHIPANYNGKTPVTLDFVGSNGQTIRSFSLHLKSRETTATGASQESPAQLKKLQEERHTAIGPGMNRFEWDLRYPDATEVTGFEPPIAAGGLDDTVEGPTVVPGTYSVVLDYGGEKLRQSFQVGLDPRIHAGPEALEAQLELELKIHAALDALDRKINQAIAVRDELRSAIRSGRLTEAQAGQAMAGLDRGIGGLVQLAIQSSEGSLVHETKLRSYLAYLAADIDLAYGRPTPAHYAVFAHLDRQAKTGENELETAIAAADKLL